MIQPVEEATFAIIKDQILTDFHMLTLFNKWRILQTIVCCLIE